MNGVGKNKMRRTMFTIHPDLKVGIRAAKGKHPSSDGAPTFSTENELTKLAAQWPGARLVEMWNQLPGVKPVARFPDRYIAIRRIWAAVQNLTPHCNIGDGLNVATKAQRILSLLQGPSGASLGALTELTGWQAHSIRGFISAQVSKRMGFKIQSFKRDGERIYRIRP